MAADTIVIAFVGTSAGVPGAAEALLVVDVTDDVIGATVPLLGGAAALRTVEEGTIDVIDC